MTFTHVSTYPLEPLVGVWHLGVLVLGETSAPIRWVFAMFITLAVLLGIFLFIIALMSVLRHRNRRHKPKQNAPRQPDVDPWSEASRRLGSKDSER